MVRLGTLLDPARRGAGAERLDAALHGRIIGQEEAIAGIVEAYQTYLAGMATPGRPIANFLFLGPTGTGKTRLVEATAEALVGDPRAVVKIDCAEFQHSHEIAKLIGSPPGYLGHRETHAVLTQEALNRYHTEKLKLSFVLFDEIEKASDALWNLLLGILDKASLTLGDNRHVDFSSTIIFLTSNLGAREMSALVSPKMGFAAAAPPATDVNDRIAHAGVEAARRKFSPEFMNRIDKVVVFHPLGEAELRRILDLELRDAGRRWEPLRVALSEPAKAYILEEGSDQRYGARHLKRAIERSLVQPMSNLVASAQVRPGDAVRVEFDAEARQLLFFKDAESVEVPPPVVAVPSEEPWAAPAAARFVSRATRKESAR